MNNPFNFEAEAFANFPEALSQGENQDETMTNEFLFGDKQLDPEANFEWEAPSPSIGRPGTSGSATTVRILWPALGFPAVISPRPGASANPAATDATRSICLLVLTSKPLSPQEASRYLRYVPWQERHRHSIPAGPSSSFSPQELIVRPVAQTGVQDDAKLCRAFSFGGTSSNSVVVSLSAYVLKKYADWGLKHLFEIRVSERASQRLAKGHYHLFWNQEQPSTSGASKEMSLLLEKFARPKEQKFGRAWQTWRSSFLEEYGLEYGARHAPYMAHDKGNKPVELLHPLFVSSASENTVRIGHVTDTHISTRSDVFERNLDNERMLLPGNSTKIQFNNWNRSFDSVYGQAKNSSDVILMTGDLIDYGRGHIARPNSGKDLGQNENYHEDRNWFLFYYLLAGHDPLNAKGRYTVPVYTTLGNHDWRLNPYPPFAPGSEDPEAFVHNYDKFHKSRELPEIMRKAHGPGHEREYSYNLNVNIHVKGLVDKIPVIRTLAAAYRAVRTAAKAGARATGYAVWGLLVTNSLDIKGTPLETTAESIAWYLLLINPFLDYQFKLPTGHQFLMVDWAEDEEVKNTDDGKAHGVRARKCLSTLQRWQVERFLASPGKAKTIGIHMPPIGPRGDWSVPEVAAGAKAYTTGPIPTVAWDPKKMPSFPLIASAPTGFHKWLAASYGSFLRHRDWFIDNLARPQNSVRLVFSGHIHRKACLVLSPVILKVPKKGWSLPEQYRVVKVSSVPPGPLPLVAGRDLGPLYVNTTSAGPRGVQNYKGEGDSYEWPGFTLARLATSGVIVAIWQGLVPPANWQTPSGSSAQRELPELALEYEDDLASV